MLGTNTTLIGEINKIFGVSETMRKDDFMNYMSDIAPSYVQYGERI